MPATLKDALGRVAALNTRNADPVQEHLKKIADEGEKTYIFNTFSVQYMRHLGSLGKYLIEAVGNNGSDNPDLWDKYSKPLIIPFLTIESYDRGEAMNSTTPWPADIIVSDLLGLKSGHRSEDLRNWGVFATTNAVPTEKELTDAKTALVATLRLALQEGDKLWSGDSKARNQVRDKHRRAARYLNVHREWMAEVQAQMSCPFCDASISPRATQCATCHNIIDEERHEAAKVKARGNKPAKVAAAKAVPLPVTQPVTQ